MTNHFKDIPKVKIKTVIIITAIQVMLLILAAIFSLGDSAASPYKYPVDTYFDIFGFPLAFLFRQRSLLLVSIDWLLYAIAIERIIAVIKQSREMSK